MSHWAYVYLFLNCISCWAPLCDFCVSMCSLSFAWVLCSTQVSILQSDTAALLLVWLRVHTLEFVYCICFFPIFVRMCVLCRLTDHQAVWQRGSIFIKQRQSTTHSCSQLENSNGFHWPVYTHCREIATDREQKYQVQQLVWLNNNNNNTDDYNNSLLYNK